MQYIIYNKDITGTFSYRQAIQINQQQYLEEMLAF